MIYESTFDADWSSLSLDETIQRAFALGVASALGEDHPEEYERLVKAQSRSLVQMAFDEGRSRATDLAARLTAPGSGRTTDEATVEEHVWARLVEDRRPSGRLRSRAGRRSRDEQPGAIDLPAMLGLPDTNPSMDELPGFLDR